MRRGENGFGAAGSKKAASGLSDAGRDSTNVACFEIQEINLVKRIPLFALLPGEMSILPSFEK